jgi:HK97 gp10 family phage protein
MALTIQTDGLKELIKQIEKLATPREIEEIDKKIIKECVEMAKKEVYSVMRVSKDVTKSGRKGSRTYIHSRNALTIKVSKKDGVIEGVLQVDDGKGNNPYFYTKFDEFEYGNSKMTPTKPFQKSFKKLRKSWEQIFEKHYNKMLETLN